MNDNLSLLNQLTDEELLSLYRQGENRARDVLSVRYFSMRIALLNRVSPGITYKTDEWDLNEAFFVAYLKAEEAYEFDKNSKFISFFCIILQNEINNVIKDIKDRSVVYYDSSFFYGEGEVIELPNPYAIDAESPSNYMNYKTVADFMKKAASKISSEAEVVFEYVIQGYSLREICLLNGMSISKGRYLLNKLKDIYRRFEEEGRKNVEEASSLSYKDLKKKKTKEYFVGKKPRKRRNKPLKNT